MKSQDSGFRRQETEKNPEGVLTVTDFFHPNSDFCSYLLAPDSFHPDS